MKLDTMQKKLIKQGLAMQLTVLSNQQDDFIRLAEFDVDVTDRIFSVKSLHIINEQMRAIKNISDQLAIPNFFTSFDKDLEEQLEIFKTNIVRLKSEELPNK